MNGVASTTKYLAFFFSIAEGEYFKIYYELIQQKIENTHFSFEKEKNMENRKTHVLIRK